MRATASGMAMTLNTRTWLRGMWLSSAMVCLPATGHAQIKLGLARNPSGALAHLAQVQGLFAAEGLRDLVIVQPLLQWKRAQLFWRWGF